MVCSVTDRRQDASTSCSGVAAAATCSRHCPSSKQWLFAPLLSVLRRNWNSPRRSRSVHPYGVVSVPNVQPEVRMNKLALASIVAHTLSVVMFVSTTFQQSPMPQLITERSIHAQLGDPTRREFVFRREGYDVMWDGTRGNPLWVQYRVVPDDLTPKVPPLDHFTVDRELPYQYRIRHQDYEGFGYDRGHMASEADQRRNLTTAAQAMLMTNVSPQDPALNRNGWRDLERYVREKAKECDETIVVTGPVFDSVHCAIGPNDEILVPAAFFKVAAFRTDIHWKIRCWLAYQNSGALEPDRLVVPLLTIEQLTGFEFFPVLNIDRERKRDVWTHHEGKPTSVPLGGGSFALDPRESDEGKLGSSAFQFCIDRGDRAVERAVYDRRRGGTVASF